ncbi:MAG: hypothetical protein HN704_06075 [Bacteroidetes bacterium]|jgi:hypothetical protein|nr:hypothetical protein [Bacteroidota bacterium]MBT6686473.1 hypothetical protein [Bacteroidota bacterium]MBT7142702.1 hypothetical protein [Bacteroidota bacterium]MBT7491154.1 hypothetical protein [Bacteroidota bacterium]
MQFIYPTFLIGLSAVLIPIIIHLFNFKRFKVVYFSNVEFLKSIKQETKAKSQLKHILVLICRILFIVFLVLAFSQPYIPLSQEEKIKEQDIVSIYIDNSFSMDGQAKLGKLIDIAKNRAVSVADAFRAETKYLLLTNDFEAKHQHFVSKEKLLQNIAEIELSPTHRKISKIVLRQNDWLAANNSKEINKSVFLISDFQKSSTDFAKLKNDTNYNIFVLPLESQDNNNLFIDSCWFEIPGRKFNQAEELFVRIKNNSDQNYQNIPMKLFLDDSLKSIASFNIESNNSEIVKLSYTNSKKGVILGRIEITDYPITYDNKFYFSYKVAEQIKILAINPELENKYISTLFKDDDYFSITNNFEKSINFSSFSTFDVIIVNGLSRFSTGFVHELSNFISNGGTVVFIPDIEGDIESYNLLFNKLSINEILSIDSTKNSITFIDYDNLIYNNVFKNNNKKVSLPEIYKQFIFTKKSRSNDLSLLRSRNGNSALSSAVYAKGKIYVFSSPLDIEYSSFVTHPIFVPTFYNIALNSQISNNLYYTIGETQSVDISGLKIDNFNGLKITDFKKTIEFKPSQQSISSKKLFIGKDIKKADNFEIYSNEKIIDGISFNYDRKESELTYFSKNELAELINAYGLNNYSIVDSKDETLTKKLSQKSRGKQLWKLFILISLLFVAIEIALLRLWK